MDADTSSPDKWALVISILSFLVAGGSLWVAISARRLAGKVGPLNQRERTIDHLHKAAASLSKGDPSSALTSIKEAIKLANLVFLPAVQNQLNRTREKVEDVSRVAAKSDHIGLQEEVHHIISQMTKEGALWPRPRWWAWGPRGKRWWRWLRTTG